MSELATTLRMAREAKGLTIAQISEKTHIMSCVLDGLERDDFSRIPAPIYGRGFVKLYCETVGIADPKPLVEAFTCLYNGAEEPIAVPPPPAAPVPPPVSAPAPAPAAEEPVDAAPPPVSAIPADETPAYAAPDFHLEADTVPPPRAFDESPEPSAASTLAPGANDLSGEPTSLSRYASPLHEYTRARIPPTVWRMALLAGGALLILWILWLGVSALYRATSNSDRPGTARPQQIRSQSVPAPTAETKSAATDRPGTASPQQASPRTPQKIDPLYMD